MKYVFVREPRVWWPVKVRVPADGGTTVDQQFDARFRILPATLYSDLLGRGHKELLAEALEGWKGIADEDGGELPFSPGARDALLDMPFVATALGEAYADAMLSGARKN